MKYQYLQIKKLKDIKQNGMYFPNLRMYLLLIKIFAEYQTGDILWFDTLGVFGQTCKGILVFRHMMIINHRILMNSVKETWNDLLCESSQAIKQVLFYLV